MTTCRVITLIIHWI